MVTIAHNSRYLKFALLIVAIFVAPLPLFAQVIISEVMYDYPGTEGSGDHDWIEVFNSGSSAVALSDWRFREANSDHTISAYPEGTSDMLAPGAYAVIANKADVFKNDTDYVGALFDSSFNLSSNGEILVMRCCGSKTEERTDRDTIIYTPIESATNNGDSIHRTSATATTFTAGVPTPGNGALIAQGDGSGETEEEVEEDQQEEEKTITATTTTLAVAMNGSTFPVEPQVFAYAGKNMTVIVGADVELTGRAFKKTGEPIENNVRFLWNFGDGSMKEGDKVLHHWSHPGKYIVVLDIS